MHFITKSKYDPRSSYHFRRPTDYKKKPKIGNVLNAKNIVYIEHEGPGTSLTESCMGSQGLPPRLTLSQTRTRPHESNLPVAG